MTGRVSGGGAEGARRAGAGERGAVLALVRGAFAFMDGVVDPPSSVHLLSEAALAEGEIWVLGDPVVACAMFTSKGEVVYLGKLAVAEVARGRGLARALVERAVVRARELGLAAVEVQVRVELTGNHAAFAAMGFVETGRTAHPGYDRATSVTMRRAV
jgi:GNAT superfamily N-acetyltransferase